MELRSMAYRGSTNHPPGTEQPLPTLEDQLADWLSIIADAHRRGEMASVAAFQHIEISLSLRPRRAWISVTQPDGTTNVIIYAAEQTVFALTRVTVLSGEVLLALGELLADTIQQTDAIACMQFLASTTPAKAGQEQEQKNAGNLRQEAPASSRDQPRTHGTNQASTPRKVACE
jgi:hypothetical protein